MIWRILVLWNVITVFCYVDKHCGREAAWAATSALIALCLPLAKIEARLGELVQAQRNRTASMEQRK
ncbi:hypothetical protein SAMN04488503_2021 [Humidesulfovibrio mexicanus]|uniref:Uncharacterized protein n=1 Tax=Humidesulfovibrio mexicanus TaxID=147047 RepID=A0A239AKQ7_9BACT|nr:hypothetical protein [Humidesulfovibrio mexicanus]SNR95654.1 hypothetical protein SAMN04488503_2021 [Humidesulfovibrio mexicanus]